MTLDKKPIFNFLKRIAQNNSKVWMDEHRDEYHHAKAIFVEIIDEVIRQVKLVDPEFIDIPTKKTLLRINRNLMFSKDKTPYKDYFGASLIKQEGKTDFYLHVSPYECFIAGGFYKPPNDMLHYIRQEIDYEPEEFLSIVEDADFRKTFGELRQNERLKTSPKGYSTDHPMIEYIRLKSFEAAKPIDPHAFLNNGYIDQALDVYKKLMPFRRFLDRALVEYRAKL